MDPVNSEHQVKQHSNPKNLATQNISELDGNLPSLPTKDELEHSTFIELSKFIGSSSPLQLILNEKRDLLLSTKIDPSSIKEANLRINKERQADYRQEILNAANFDEMSVDSEARLNLGNYHKLIPILERVSSDRSSDIAINLLNQGRLPIFFVHEIEDYFSSQNRVAFNPLETLAWAGAGALGTYLFNYIGASAAVLYGAGFAILTYNDFNKKAERTASFDGLAKACVDSSFILANPNLDLQSQVNSICDSNDGSNKFITASLYLKARVLNLLETPPVVIYNTFWRDLVTAENRGEIDNLYKIKLEQYDLTLPALREEKSQNPSKTWRTLELLDLCEKEVMASQRAAIRQRLAEAILNR